MTSKTAIHVFTRLLPIGSLLVSLPLVSLLVSPALADSTAQTDTNGATATPVKAPLHPKKHKVAKAPSPDIVPTHKAAAPAPVVDTSGPLDLNVTYTGELWQNTGGFNSGTDYMYEVDASLSVDTQKLFGWQGGRFYVEGFYAGGNSLDFTYTGALQAPSALDAYDSMNLVKLYQLYYDQQIGNTNVMVGRFDVQQQFGTTRPMDLFANKAQAINYTFLAAGQAAGFNDPSIYPDTTIGLRIKQTFGSQWTVKLGLLNGLSDSPDARNTTDILIGPKEGALGIGEVDFTPDKYTKFMVGTWGLTGQLNKIAQFSPTYAQLTTWGDAGAYVGGATRLYTIEGNRGVDAFFNVGVTNAITNISDLSVDAGVTITGLFGARPNDKLGAAVGVIETTPGYQKLMYLYQGLQIAQYETAYELTYRAKITDWLAIQPEVDYITNPDIAGKKSAFAYGLHFELHKEFN